MNMFLKLFKNPTFIFGLVLFTIPVLFSLFYPLFLPADALAGNLEVYMEPGSGHILGANHVGVDMLTLLAYGMRSSLYVGIVTGIVATIVGTFIGVLSGYKGGLIDNILTLITNMFIVIPAIVVLILISNSLKEGRSLTLIAVLIGSITWTWSARAVRAQAASLKSRDHVNLAKLNGYGTISIIVMQILPYLLSYVFMVFILQMGCGILMEATLSMMGLGPYDTTSLGIILNDAMRNEALLDGSWWAFGPAMFLITIIVYSLYVLNTSMEGVFNPRLRK